MATARYSTTDRWSAASNDARDDLSHLQLTREERIGAPVASCARRVWRRVILLACMLGLGWLGLENRDTAGHLFNEAKTRAVTFVEAMTRTSNLFTPPETKQAAQSTGAGELLPLVEAEQRKSDESAPQVADISTAALARAGTTYEEPTAPPTNHDALDPLQTRAESIGLHPGLSPVILARLSDADWRNAKAAIETALHTTPDQGEFTYPEKRQPTLALFRIHFVAGAAEDCRRYVVAIAKDGWLTTALPVERCGIKMRAAKSG